MLRRLTVLHVAAACIGLAACQEAPTSSVETPERMAPETASFRGSAQDVDAQLRASMEAVNAWLEAEGSDIRVAVAEWLAAPNGADEVGRTVFFRDVGDKKLGFHFVPNDPRRTWSVPDGVTYLVDASDGAATGGLDNAQTEPAIDRAMATWNAERCSDLNLGKTPDPGVDPDLVDFLLGFGGAPGAGWPFADIVHAGWTAAFAPPTLGVTFTFGFTSGGQFTDIDNDGRLDAALREIYYSNNFSWRINGNIDVETVALHEAGHGLSQAHFGTLFRTDANGQFHFAPRAVMNAGYTGPQQNLANTDQGGHCTNWGSWPSG